MTDPHERECDFKTFSALASGDEISFLKRTIKPETGTKFFLHEKANVYSEDIDMEVIDRTGRCICVEVVHVQKPVSNQLNFLTVRAI